MKHSIKKAFTLLAALMMATGVVWADGYYVVGNMTDWAVNSQYKMIVNPANSAEYLISLKLASNAEFKVVYSNDDAAITYWYPSNGGNYGENGELSGGAGQYTIYFRPDGNGGSDWFYNYFYVASGSIDLNTSPVPLTKVDATHYTFAMPAYDVEVTTDLYYNLNEDASDNESKYGTKTNVFLTRTLQAGGWNTFCAPFDIVDVAANFGDDVQVKAFSGSEYNAATETLTLNFADANHIDAGTPYLVRLGGTSDLNLADDGYEFANITPKWTLHEVTGTGGYATFVPILEKTNLAGSQNILFVTGGNTLTYPTTAGPMKGFRAYFRLKLDDPATGGGNSTGARTFVMSFGDETGIESIDNLTIDNLRFNGAVYTLDGRKIENSKSVNRKLPKGVYVVNGKKTVIK